jgi:hypothetical protein
LFGSGIIDLIICAEYLIITWYNNKNTARAGSGYWLKAKADGGTFYMACVPPYYKGQNTNTGTSRFKKKLIKQAVNRERNRTWKKLLKR